MTDGIVNLNKPIGYTSHDCVMILRRIFNTKKVGHTGTLDPAVHGVLPICIGEATKVVPYLTDTDKTYQAEITLGISTETEDQTGEVLESIPLQNIIDEREIERVLQQFLGESTQKTPLYSAVKVNGKKLYEYARQKIPVERPERQINVKQLKLTPGTLRKEADVVKFSFEATVSKGTYIRTLCVDLGKALGYPAHMSHLIRTRTAAFALAEAVTLEELEQLKDQQALHTILHPLQTGLLHLPVWEVDEELKKRIGFGQKLSRPEGFLIDTPYRMERDGELLAIYQTHPEDETIIKSLRGFNL
ncbi:tRNA pseudouridine55 synthase [Halolactibacillus halophilus]|uniref:tRNA pseudouridine synthase B n=1 Tax=Halolactibacillus halophilus TaxID=306540 RepID=A0A1I5LHS3_9BACI|nr:tRNA pseudouridine(55) synthase TruB [Halolactibacillus halophilus]GEM00814.1 tRNA pseudouridine synthase B [Halolactibacillus halophilus]SFO96860.1 tRNA pseudouridine55 synthase [Halolactibacillus halophilus]